MGTPNIPGPKHLQSRCLNRRARPRWANRWIGTAATLGEIPISQSRSRRRPNPAQQPPPPVTPATVTPMPPGLTGETGTDSGEYDMTQASRMAKAFLDKIASFESEGKGGYHAVNKNALGRYQLTRLARHDAGLHERQVHKEGNEWLEIYAPHWDKWIGTYGAASKQEFLNSPLAQELAMEEYMRKMAARVPDLQNEFNGLIIHGIGSNGDGLNDDGITPVRIQIEEGAILGAGHREGLTRVRQYLVHLNHHDGDSFKALTFEAVRAKNPGMSDEDVAGRLAQYKSVETRLRQFQGVGAWKQKVQ